MRLNHGLLLLLMLLLLVVLLSLQQLGCRVEPSLVGTIIALPETKSKSCLIGCQFFKSR